MASLASLQASLAAIEAAYASGHLNVKYGERSITDHSPSEQRAVITDLKAQIAALQGTTRKRSTRMRQSGRGY